MTGGKPKSVETVREDARRIFAAIEGRYREKWGWPQLRSTLESDNLVELGKVDNSIKQDVVKWPELVKEAAGVVGLSGVQEVGILQVPKLQEMDGDNRRVVVEAVDKIQEIRKVGGRADEIKSRVQQVVKEIADKATLGFGLAFLLLWVAGGMVDTRYDD